MDNSAVSAPHVVVVGGGISGLAAAHRLLESGARVTVLEATDRLGGKLFAGEIAGARVDLGAESMLARRPEGVGLAREVGLQDRLRPPAATAAIWTRGALRPMPKGHLMGVPADPASLAGIVSAEGLARIAQDRELPPTEVGEDIGVGEFVARRVGREVVDRLVEPLLGGVYAGDAYRISMRAAVPQLYTAARENTSLLDGVARVQAKAAAGPQQGGPVFLGLDGGMGTLPLAVADAVRAGGGLIRTGAPVLALTRTADGWLVRTDSAEAPAIEADGVVLASPAWSASRLLAAESPSAAAELAGVEYASMALVTMAFRRADLERLERSSGFLVPSVDGRTIKASTFSSYKWQWVTDRAPDLFVLRTSIGRYGEEEHLEREDAELVEMSLGDLGEAVGLAARPVATEVTRWTGGLPQYPVGHLARVARVRAAVAKLPGLRVCGAAYDGVGIPACIAGARLAADEIIATSTLAQNTQRDAGQ
ncbi:protoporphyrinogen oxidase [Streptomyces sp. ERV7]|uniref:protoporphyrinogen oxidase n=1 Tax=Streptomyces sp. ERV7 TaxID=1322334 RepID=UPI0007F4B9B2|nr:protoporphyrinogen oxidase [Streptomyces sp. ERV7]OAR22717.1 protoporphyrinogen oxidase [Streptomyces sp. ERV7]